MCDDLKIKLLEYHMEQQKLAKPFKSLSGVAVSAHVSATKGMFIWCARPKFTEFDKAVCLPMKFMDEKKEKYVPNKFGTYIFSCEGF